MPPSSPVYTSPVETTEALRAFSVYLDTDKLAMEYCPFGGE